MKFSSSCDEGVYVFCSAAALLSDSFAIEATHIPPVSIASNLSLDPNSFTTMTKRSIGTPTIGRYTYARFLSRATLAIYVIVRFYDDHAPVFASAVTNGSAVVVSWYG